MIRLSPALAFRPISWFHHKVLLTCSFFSLPNAVLGLLRGCGLKVSSLPCSSTPCPSCPPAFSSRSLSFPLAQRRRFRRDEHSELWDFVLGGDCTSSDCPHSFVSFRLGEGFPVTTARLEGALFGCLPWGRFVFLWIFFRGKSTRRWYMTALRASGLSGASCLILQTLMERHKLSMHLSFRCWV